MTLDERRKAFRDIERCSEGIFKLNLILKAYRRLNKCAFIASMDAQKAFNSILHKAIYDSRRSFCLPDQLIDYIHLSYEDSATTLSCDDWTSEELHPTVGVKQGDSLDNRL